MWSKLVEALGEIGYDSNNLVRAQTGDLLGVQHLFELAMTATTGCGGRRGTTWWGNTCLNCEVLPRSCGAPHAAGQGFMLLTR